MRDIRWIGDPSPLEDPTIRAALAAGRVPPRDLLAIRFFENQQRISVVAGVSELTLGPQHGFRRTYRFGPQNFVVTMEDADADRLFANEWDRWQFRDVTDVPAALRPPLTAQHWRALLASFAKLDAGRRLRDRAA